MDIKVIGSGSSGNCYRISDGNTALLLDAGLPLTKIQLGCDFKLSEISAALISHSHGDHIKGAAALVGRGIDVYASPDTLAEGRLEGYRYHAVQPLNPFNINSFSIVAFDLHHDVRNFGYQLMSTETGERLIYMTDTYYTDYVFPKTNYLLIECNYSIDAVNESIAKGYIPEALKHRLLSSHMSLEHFIGLLKANDLRSVKAIYLLHLSDSNGRADEFKEAVQKVAGCEVYIA